MSYVSSYYHCVFSTKDRRPMIAPALRERLWPYLGGIARENQMKAIEVGGMPDHVHVLLSLPSTLPIARALQLIKGGSSKWVHDTFPEHRLFRWQVKYGAFGVGFRPAPISSTGRTGRFRRLLGSSGFTTYNAHYS